MATYINTQYDYTIQTYDDGSKLLTVKDKYDDTLEFDLKNGNILVASDFESLSEEYDTPPEWTLDEFIRYSTEFLTEWDIDQEVVASIVNDLMEWFKGCAISKADAIRREIKLNEDAKRGAEKQIAKLTAEIRGYRDEIAKMQELIDLHNRRVGQLVGKSESCKAKIRNLNRQLGQ